MVKKMVIYVLFSLAVCVWSRAQESQNKVAETAKASQLHTLPLITPGEAPAKNTEVAPEISADEQLQLRNVQVDIMQTYQLLLDLQDQQKKLWGTLYEKYKLSPDQYVTCDGPGPKPCETVPHGKIAFKKKEAEKK